MDIAFPPLNASAFVPLTLQGRVYELLESESRRRRRGEMIPGPTACRDSARDQA